jgi:hypothetical protein
MTMTWTKDETSVDPPSKQMIAGEDLTLAFDATAYLSGSQTVSSPTAHLYRLDDGSEVPLADTPTLGTGNTIQQRVRNLTAGITYRLHVFFTAGGNVEAMTLYIECLP